MQEPHTLDISRISPMAKFKLMGVLRRSIFVEWQSLTRDIREYWDHVPESNPVKMEMRSWESALSDLNKQRSERIKDQNITIVDYPEPPPRVQPAKAADQGQPEQPEEAEPSSKFEPIDESIL